MHFILLLIRKILGFFFKRKNQMERINQQKRMEKGFACFGHEFISGMYYDKYQFAGCFYLTFPDILLSLCGCLLIHNRIMVRVCF